MTSVDDANHVCFGPQALPRALVLTFDNLGEASELERGTWEPSAALGRHPSVLTALPRLLDELDALRLTATFFVEALNCELYPDALCEISGRGHELGVHGWRHEPWAELSPRRERGLLLDACHAFSSLGLQARAFRPPGGEPTGHTATLLRELGYDWWSPHGERWVREDGLATMPFDWRLVDAYLLMERFEKLRVAHGERRAPLAPDAATKRLAAELAGGAGAQTLILHPFLMTDTAWWEGARRVLADVAELRRAGRAWTVPGRELAGWLAENGG
jgi:peptidoglycan/xylan/chitin deacetylase (PgdA/CDA1 family)